MRSIVRCRWPCLGSFPASNVLGCRVLQSPSSPGPRIWRYGHGRGSCFSVTPTMASDVLHVSESFAAIRSVRVGCISRAAVADVHRCIVVHEHVGEIPQHRWSSSHTYSGVGQVRPVACMLLLFQTCVVRAPLASQQHTEGVSQEEDRGSHATHIKHPWGVCSAIACFQRCLHASVACLASLLARSPRGRNALVSGGAVFPVLSEGVDAGLTSLEVAHTGLLTVPALATYSWAPAFTVSGCRETSWNGKRK